MKFSILKRKYPDIKRAEVTKLSKDADSYYRKLLERMFGHHARIKESNGNPLAILDEDKDWVGYNNETAQIYICPRFIEVIFGEKRANVLLFDSENQKIPYTLFKKFLLNSKLKTITGDAYTYKIKDNKIVDYDDNKATASAASRKFLFSDGSIITASCVDEAKAKHKVMASDKINIEAIEKDIKDAFKKESCYVTEKLGEISVSYPGSSLNFNISVEGVYKPKFEVVVRGDDYILNKRLILVKKFNTLEDVTKYCRQASKIFDKMENDILSTRDNAYKAIKSLK